MRMWGLVGGFVLTVRIMAMVLPLCVEMVKDMETILIGMMVLRLPSVSDSDQTGNCEEE